MWECYIRLYTFCVLPVVPPASLVLYSTVSLQVAVIILVSGAKWHATVGGRPLLHHTAPPRQGISSPATVYAKV